MHQVLMATKRKTGNTTSDLIVRKVLQGRHFSTGCGVKVCELTKSWVFFMRYCYHLLLIISERTSGFPISKEAEIHDIV